MTAGLLEQGQRSSIRQSSRTALLDYRLKEAASSLRRAVGTAGPFQGLRADREQQTPPTTPPGLQYLQGTVGRTDLPDGYAEVHCCKRTTQPHDLLGAGRRVSPMLGILANFWGKLLHVCSGHSFLELHLLHEVTLLI